MNALEVLIEQIDDDLDQLTQALQFGDVHSFEQFRFLRGQIWGLMVAKEKVQALSKTIEES